MRIAVLFLLLALGLADQFVPIPKTPYGFSMGDPQGELHIEAFLDFQCTLPPMQAPTPNSPTLLSAA
jgi:hypothetical protein